MITIGNIKDEILKNIHSLKNSIQGYEYSCSMIPLPDEPKKTIQSYIRYNIDLEDVYYGEEDCGNYGVEHDSHVTIIYGYETNDLEEIKSSFDLYVKNCVEFTLGQVRYFAHKLFYVLYIEIKQSYDLKELRRISTNSGLKIFSSYPKYTPHITLAYIAHGTFKKYERLIGDAYFDGIKCVSNKLKITTADGNSRIYEF